MFHPPVYCFLDKILEDETISSSDKELIIWSDGPSSEFKNQFMARLVHILAERLGRKVTWKYFATSHGKGVVDGLSGKAKSTVRVLVMGCGPNAPVVQTAWEFFQVVQTRMKTKFFFISREDVLNHVVSRDLDWRVGGVAIEGITFCHVIESIPGSHCVNCFRNMLEFSIEPFRVAKYSSIGIACTAPTIPEVVAKKYWNIDDWVVVTYENERYPGQVKLIEEDITDGRTTWETKVSVMVPAGKETWRWPDVVDAVFYRAKDIIKKLPEGPVPVHSSREIFKFNMK